MYKVLVVDDEVLVRIGLRSMINWEENGFRIVGEASNGEMAYEKFLMLKPELVITDISMPRRDGFWLIEKIRKENPETAIIVLTCYDEFEYVRKALKFQVSEYLLKAEMEEQEILNIVKAKKSRLDREKNPEADQNTGLEKNYQDQLLVLLLNNDKPEQEILDILKKHDIAPAGGRFCFLQMDFTDSLLEGKYSRERAASILNASCRLVETHLSEHFKVCLTKPFGKTVTCILGDEGLTQNFLEEELVYVADSLKQYFSIDFKSGNSQITNGILNLRKDSEWVYQMTDWLFYYENGDHVRQIDHLPVRTADEGVDKQQSKQLRACIEQANSQEITAILEHIRSTCIDQKDASVNCKLKMVHLMDEIYHECEIYLINEKYDFFEYQQNVLAAENIEMVVAALAAYINKVIHIVIHSRVDNSEVLIGKAVDYIKENYTGKCSLEEVAGYINISKYYFSNLFKKVKGINFSAYLNQVRIEQARKLLTHPGITISEVCEQTGFNDQQYFSKTFKKYTGITITEYRKI